MGCVNLKVDWIPPCSEKERWYSPTQYAVMKPGAKRATRCLDTYQEAEKYGIENNITEYTIEDRGADNTRCKFYCELKEFCPYFKEFVPEPVEG